MRLKETPGGLPLTFARRIAASTGLASSAGWITYLLLSLHASSDPLVRHYWRLKALSVVSQNARVWALHAEQTTPVLYFVGAAAFVACCVGVMVWRFSDPGRRRLIVERGQIADSDELVRQLRRK